MPSTCIVCGTRHSKTSDVQFFRFPMKDPVRLAKWVKAVKRKNWRPTNASRLCSTHFTSRDYMTRPGTSVPRLRLDAVPTRALSKQIAGTPHRTPNANNKLKPIKQQKKQSPSKSKTSPKKSPAASPNANKTSKNPKQSRTLRSPQHNYPTRISSNKIQSTTPVRTYHKKMVNSKPTKTAPAKSSTPPNRKPRKKLKIEKKENNKSEEQVENDALPDDSLDDNLDMENVASNPQLLYKKLDKYKDRIPALDALINLSRNLGAENEALRRRLTDVESRLDFWSVEKIANDDVATRCYTGLPSYSAFLWLFKTLEQKVESISLEESLTDSEDEELEKSSETETEELPFIDQLLMVLMRLKVGLLIEDLAGRFGIRRSYAKSIFATWISAMESVFRANYPLLPKGIMKLHVPFDFKNFPSTRILLASVRIQVQYGFVITVKDCHKYPTRLKFLLGVMPNGVVCFVSEPFGNQAQESSMVQSSGILKILQAGDLVMGPDWPGVKKIFAESGVLYVAFPSSVSAQNQFRELSKLSAFVEEKLNCLKKFSIVTADTVPLSRTENVGKIFTVCAFLVNLVRKDKII